MKLITKKKKFKRKIFKHKEIHFLNQDAINAHDEVNKNKVIKIDLFLINKELISFIKINFSFMLNYLIFILVNIYLIIFCNIFSSIIINLRLLKIYISWLLHRHWCFFTWI